MRLGGPILEAFDGPAGWIAALRQRGYTTATWPLGADADDATVDAFVAAAAEADIVIAEVGAWNNNPLNANENVRQQAIANIQERLALADRVGACCCVNVAGSRGDRWDGPDAHNYSAEAFEQIVASVQTIIDGVRPTRTFYTLEPMPWMLPDSVESYVALLEAIDRPQFAVHFDPVNIVTHPRLYYDNGAMIRAFCAELGPHIKAVHAKDTLLHGDLTAHLDEVPPGQGNLDYATLLAELEQLNPDMPVLMEHFHDESAYETGAAYIRRVAAEVGVVVK